MDEFLETYNLPRLNHEEIDFRWGIRQGCQRLLLVFYMALEILARAIGQEKNRFII